MIQRNPRDQQNHWPSPRSGRQIENSEESLERTLDQLTVAMPGPSPAPQAHAFYRLWSWGSAALLPRLYAITPLRGLDLSHVLASTLNFASLRRGEITVLPLA